MQGERRVDVARAWRELQNSKPDPARAVRDAAYVLDSDVDWAWAHRAYVRASDLFPIQDNAQWQAILAPAAGWINFTFLLLDDGGLIITVHRGPDQVPAGVEPFINAAATDRLGRIETAGTATN